MTDYPSLYGILDLGYTKPEDAEAVTADLLAGGLRLLQLRGKGWDKGIVADLACRLAPLCRAAGCLFIVNDYPEIAVLSEADGVHIGQDDGAIDDVRALVGEKMIIGRSTHSIEQALAAHAEAADYIGFGPLFPTGTKPGREPIGLQDIAHVQKALGDYPIYCIGGVNPQTLPQVLAAGARRVVIVSWLLQQVDIPLATRQLIAQI